MIDIGANLASPSFSNDLDEVLVRAQHSGVKHIIVTGSDLDSNGHALSIAETHRSFLSCTAGLHPHHAKDWDDKISDQISQLIDREQVVAIGETGLDYNRNFSTPAQQRLAFSKHLDLAESVEKPLFLHQRDAHDDFFAMLSERPNLAKRSVVHCFTDSEHALQAYIEAGTMIGITGWLCDAKRGRSLREIVSNIPNDKLMIESDAPYLMPHRDKLKKELVNKNRNEPCTLIHVARQLAECRNTSTEEIIAQTTRNTARFFSLSI